MGLETAPFIADLVATNPVFNDKKRQGDDHLRLVKGSVQATLPNASKAFYFPETDSKTSNFSVLASEMNKTFMVSTGAGEVTATLPSLAAGDDGWCCHFIKTNAGTNALFVAPAAGTLTSGEVGSLAKCRRVIPGHRCTAVWDGTGWFVTRNAQAPVGSCIEFHGANLPVGYEWPNGQTLASASTKYPEYNSVIGSGATLDRCGRVGIGKDDMGEASNNRITVAGCGIDGDVLGNAGGAETHTLTEAQLAAHTHGGSTGSNGAHTHSVDVNHQVNAFAIGGGGPPTANSDNSGADQLYTTSSNGDHTHSIPSAGSGTAHNNVQPGIVVNLILVVE